MSLTYSKHEKISLKDNQNFNEKWLQKIISEDPSILWLGDLLLKEIERPLSYGRLDVLLKDEGFKKSLQEYYTLRGWDKRGIPTKEKLKELGLEKYAKGIF